MIQRTMFALVMSFHLIIADRGLSNVCIQEMHILFAKIEIYQIY